MNTKEETLNLTKYWLGELGKPLEEEVLSQKLDEFFGAGEEGEKEMGLQEYVQWFSTNFQGHDQAPNLGPPPRMEQEAAIESGFKVYTQSVSIAEASGKEIITNEETFNRTERRPDGMLRLMAPREPDPVPEIDAIGFARVECQVLENERSGMCQVPVERKGTGDCEISFTWTAKRDPASMSEKQFVPQNDVKATMPKGQFKIELPVQIKDNDAWGLEAKQWVEINVNSIKNATEGSERKVGVGEMHRTSVVILNDDAFPQGQDPQQREPDSAPKIEAASKALKKAIHELDAEDDESPNKSAKEMAVTEAKKDLKAANKRVHSERTIVTAFFWHLFDNMPGKHPSWYQGGNEAVWGMVFQLYPPLHWVMTQLMMMLSLNLAFKEKKSDPTYKDEDFRVVIYTLAAAYLVSLFIWTHNSWQMIELRLGGKARKNLREAICGTMIQLTEEEQENFPSGEVSGIALEAVEEAVTRCWGGVFGLIGNCWFIIVLTAYTFYIARKHVYLIIIPVVQVLADFVVLRMMMPKQVELANTFLEAADVWRDNLGQISDVRFLITSYKAGTRLRNKFGALVQKDNGTRWAFDKYVSDFMKVLKWVHSIFIVICFAVGAELHLKGNDSFPSGSFVVLMGTIFKYDAVISNLFGQIFSLNIGYVYICKIATLLNAQTRRKADLEFQDGNKKGEKHRPKTPYHNDDDITMGSCRYFFKEGGVDPDRAQTTMQVGGDYGFNLAVEQGQVICIKAPPGTNSTGKKSVLKMIANVILPNEGYVTYPGDLRVRYLPAEPLLWKGSLMENLKWGNMNKSTKIPDEEIWEVWDAIGGNKAYHSGNTLGEDVGANGCLLSNSDRIFVAIARALLSSVDLLVIGSTLDGLGEIASTHILAVLRRWVEERGLRELTIDSAGGVPVMLKKKKTCFFSTKTEYLPREADSVLELDANAVRRAQHA